MPTTKEKPTRKPKVPKGPVYGYGENGVHDKRIIIGTPLDEQKDELAFDRDAKIREAFDSDPGRQPPESHDQGMISDPLRRKRKGRYGFQDPDITT